jgi:predicted amidophosphoribosyltransferase
MVIVCVVSLAMVGTILKLILDDIGGGDTCPYCWAPLARAARICPQCQKALGKG